MIEADWEAFDLKLSLEFGCESIQVLFLLFAEERILQQNGFVVEAEKLVACVVLRGVLHGVFSVTHVDLDLLVVLQTAEFAVGTHIFYY